jgi:acylphosphatase
MKEIKATISGKVQGVNFRNFVNQKASSLWLSGYVKNIPDYKLEVRAQGKEESLLKLIEHLHKGPFASKPSGVEVEWMNPTEKYNGFKIIY